ncbi:MULTISPECIES: DUF6896 domain-containing protein [Kamptonema]|uniref:DUF6896 domain-containing protein n=1 Tax=Kamptonema TaxID=1501433 RepID=UPI0001DAC60F|nr:MULTISPECIES: hypothetical protein [Kamptonema]CBN59084.1 hypothetical protein OSCI_4020010 [Kamptonema sp. PCC 6506]
MNYLTKNVDAVAIIQEFANLQDELISVFRQKYSNLTDWTYLLDCPRSGYFHAREEEWRFQQHGLGICFTGQESGKVVDVHTGLLDAPRAIDSWRLCQYFESIGIEKIHYLSQIFEVSEQDGSEALLKCLRQDDTKKVDYC